MRVDEQDIETLDDDEDQEGGGLSPSAAVLSVLILVALVSAAAFAVAYVVSLLGTLLSRITPLTPFQSTVVIAGGAVGGVGLILLGRMADRLAAIEGSMGAYLVERFFSPVEPVAAHTRRQKRRR